MQDDCYKVSILEMVKKASFIPHETGEMKTVEDAYQSFVPWPKYLVKIDGNVCFLQITCLCFTIVFAAYNLVLCFLYKPFSFNVVIGTKSQTISSQ